MGGEALQQGRDGEESRQSWCPYHHPTCSHHLTSVPGPQLAYHCLDQPQACSSPGMHSEGMLNTRSLPRQTEPHCTLAPRSALAF